MFLFRCIVLFVILLNLSESLLFKFLFYFFHVLFLSFLLLLFFYFLFFLSFLFFPHLSQVLLESQITLLDKTYKVLNCFDIIFLFFLSFLLILFLHTSFHPSILGISSIILFAPSKGFVGGKIFPIFIKGKYFVDICV